MTATDNLLQDARTVAIVVHGVGDHSDVDILDEAAKGAAAFQDSGFLVRRIQLTGIPSEPPPYPIWEKHGDDNPSLSSLSIEVDGSRHVILPIVWSDFRLRAQYWPKWSDPVSIAVSIPLWGYSLLLLSVDCLRCIPKARAPWIPALAGVAVFVICAALGAYLSARFAINNVYAAESMFSPVYGAFGLLLVGCIVKLTTPAFDFVGDVVRYVASDSFRQKRIAALANVLAYVLRAAPKAKTMVVGDSLGSVLVAQSALHLGSTEHSDRIVVATIGSPLRLMSDMFKGTVPSADELVKSYSESPLIAFWANLWRDQDFIGRALRPDAHARYAERSLGNGPHWNAWSDSRLWRAIIEILLATRSGTFEKLRESWKPAPLDEEELREYEARSEKLA
ncbi:MAG: hypothetical protein Q7W02_19790 [Candidatus Rokubacteria bacterium]|nr:hypothetical protein [Candidatus Rokubacteria bacterium]